MSPWVTESGVEGVNWSVVSGDEIFDLPMHAVLRGVLTGSVGTRVVASALKNLWLDCRLTPVLVNNPLSAL